MLAISDAVDFDALEICALRRPLPGAAEKVDAVPARDDPGEDFPEVKLGAAGLRIFVILPVEYEYPH